MRVMAAAQPVERIPVATAVATSGRAVLLAGSTVVIALMGMFVMALLFTKPAESLERLAPMAPKAARARRRVPGPLRRIPMKVEVAKVMETWRLGYLLDTIFTRDTWIHRVDIARATGRDLLLTPEHDGRLVADVVAEWPGVTASLSR